MLFASEPADKPWIANAVPDKVRSWILTAPIEGKVQGLIAGHCAWVGIGLKHGVFRGMRLRTRRPEPYIQSWAVVLSAEESACTVGRADSWANSFVESGELLYCEAKGAEALKRK